MKSCGRARQCPSYNSGTPSLQSCHNVPPLCTLTSAHFTLHTLHCTLHTIHYTLNTTHRTLNTKQYTLDMTTHCTLHTAHCTLHTAHCKTTAHFKMNTKHNTVHTAKPALPLHTTSPHVSVREVRLLRCPINRTSFPSREQTVHGHR